MQALIHPTYFPNIAHFATIVQANNILFEHQDNYQKQTYRNRMCLYSANRKQTLSIPILHSHNSQGRQAYKDVKIDYSINWQKNHLKSLETNYRSSAYYEFYEADISPLFEEKVEHLIDFNYKTIEIISQCLQINFNNSKTESYNVSHKNTEDYRHLAIAKKEQKVNFLPYFQIFSERYGFIENLSILDLLFNEGPQSLNYLKNISLKTLLF